jgi:hypothetical protein
MDIEKRRRVTTESGEHYPKKMGCYTHPFLWFVLKKLLLIVVIVPLLSSCASLLDGKFVTKDNKPGPFQPQIDKYEMPKDPTSPF